MRRYLCAIIGNGDIDAPLTDETGPFRPAVADYAVNWTASIDVDNDGRPLSATAVVKVATEDHSIFSGDSRITPMEF